MTLVDYKKAVEARITEWFDQEKKSTPTMESRLLLDRMCAVAKRGGKRARPVLFYMTYAAYGGKDTANLIDLGLALEFHHQFLLTHDDIIDDDAARYNGPNVMSYYLQNNTVEISEAMALLAGDLLFTFSNRAISDSRNFSSSQKVALLKVLNGINTAVAYGQQLDVFNNDPASANFIEHLLVTHSLKSASYSTQLPMDCAATLLKLSGSERAKICAFAEPFGVLFQLTDDYSDYFANKSAFNNRPKYRDFRQGKVTYPLYVALKMANKKQAGYIRRRLGNKALPEPEMQEVVNIFEDCGAKTVSHNYLTQFLTQAGDALNHLSIDEKHKRQFRKLLEKYRV